MPSVAVLSTSWFRGLVRIARGGVSPQIGWIIASKAALVVSNGAVLVIVAHYTTLSEYGVFVTVIGAQLFLSRVLMLGVDTGLIRLRSVSTLRDHASEVVGAGLCVILLTSTILLAAIGTGGSAIARLIAEKDTHWVLASIAAGAVGVALVDYWYAYRLACLEYRAAALFQGGTAVARLAVTSLASVLYPHSPLILAAYPAASVLSGVAHSLAFVARAALPDRAVLRQLLGYSVWLAGADMAAVLGQYQGTFLLTLLGDQSAAGLFGFALGLSLAFMALSHAMFEYFFSHMAGLGSLPRVVRYFPKAIAAAAGVAIACVPVIVGTAWVLSIIARPDLAAAASLFAVLAASMLLLLIQAPFSAAALFLMRPQWITATLVMRVVAVAGLGIWLVPLEGAKGGALAQLWGTAGAVVTLVGITMVSLRRSEYRG